MRSAKRAGDRERDPDRHLVAGPGRVEEHERADDEARRAGERERAVAHDERLGGEERGGEEHEQDPGRADREHLEAEEARR